MTIYDVIVYVQSATILAAYAAQVGTGDTFLFHLANALCGFCIILATLVGTGWSPLLTLTFAFTALGFVGVYRGMKEAWA